jgi:hypothetical protein
MRKGEIMSDYSELKELAKARHDARWLSMDSVSIKTILALISDHDELVDLRARLAERDSLLKGAIHELRYPMATGWEDKLADELESALSASAEPSAPAELDERAEFEKWVCCGWPDAPVDQFSGNRYRVETIQRAWVAWKARASLGAKP